METKNRFYIGKSHDSDIFYGYYYNINTGELVENSENCFALMKENTQSVGPKRITLITNYSQLADEDRTCILMWDANNNYLGFQDEHLDNNGNLSAILKYDTTKYVAIYIAKRDYSGSTNWRTVKITVETEVFPHYKQLKKKYAKENGQVFFRESLDGKINLWGTDYERIKNASLEDILLFSIYQNGIAYASASFNKSDCKFDHFKKSVELKLTYNDKYSKILDAYENTYDLIKLAPALTQLTLTKRCVTQIYIQGENVVSNYAGGTYWETEVDEQINDPDLLTNKYYFARGPKYVEVSLQGFNYNINAAYRGLWNNNVWNATSYVVVQGVKYRIPCSIVFTKVHSANDYAGAVDPGNVKILSSGGGNGVRSIGDDDFYYMYDTYRIEIYTGNDGTGTKIYQSDNLYGKDGNFTLNSGSSLYPMSRIEQPIPQMDPTPNNFNLGNYVIEYQIWGRMLCDVNSISDGQGGTINTYDLPKDDFATPRRNYRRCIGLRGFEDSNSVVKIVQSQQTTEEPTSYGMNDFGEYFIAPTTLWAQYYHPLSRSAWANTSMWVELYEVSYPHGGYEVFCRKYYKEYTLKNAYHIADVIKSLLAEIDSTISHDKTAVYSQFLYGHSGATASALGNCDLYITQKTNILKGEYDQAAQKAEIKLKQLMEMLRDCFRCYWFIDDQNRFRIEHISYFMKGLSYYAPTIQFDLTSKKDKFNKKQALYCQRELEFDKADLASRNEFAWMDDTTKAMGGDLWVNINNNYIQKDKTEEINVDGFTTDIDYMLFLPDDFSDDGFALLMADSNKKVPIIRQGVKEEKQNDRWNTVDVQNWYASFNQLIWHYMEDMPGSSITYNNVGSLYVTNVKRCMKHNIEFSSKDLAIDVYKMITTDEGNGYIEEVTTNIDTDLTEVELRYTPS